MPSADELLEEALDAWEDGDFEDALELAEEVLRGDPEDLDAERIAGAALLELGRATEALPLLQRVAAHEEDADTLARLGQAYFETLDFAQARVHLERALKKDPTLADALYWLAHLDERDGKTEDAKRRFREAARLAPDAFPPAFEVPEETFRKHVEEAIAELPEDFRAALTNLAIIVEPTPPVELLDTDPPFSPAILGMFTGTPRPERSGNAELPNTIHLFQKNIERAATNHDELVDEIRITLLHEIGHYLGLDEDEVDDRGLR